MYAGIDIGGTYIKYALIDDDFQIIKKWKKKTEAIEAGAAFYDMLCEDVKNLALTGIGISVPGVISQEGEVKSKAAKSLWALYQTNVKQEVEQRLHVCTYAINDAKAAGYYEASYGSARCDNNSITVILGTGIGGSICVNQKILNGKDGFAGEVSSLPFPKGGNMGRWCDYASVSALCDHYQSLTGKVGNGELICELYQQQDEVCVSLLDEWIEDLCTGLVMLTVICNPDCICIGGGISEQGWLIDRIRHQYKALCKVYTQSSLITTKVVVCSAHNDTNLLGAVAYQRVMSQ